MEDLTNLGKTLHPNMRAFCGICKPINKKVVCEDINGRKKVKICTRKLTNEEQERVIDLYHRHYSYPEIAEMVKVGPGQARSLIKRGVEAGLIQKRGSKPLARYLGVDEVEVAKAYEYSMETIKQLCDRFNVAEHWLFAKIDSWVERGLVTKRRK